MATSDFTIADVLAWARTKPTNGTYSYTDSRTCALAQFGEATNRPNCIGFEGSRTLWQMRDLKEALNPGVDTLCAGVSTAQTYGALVARLERLCPSAPAPASEWIAIDAYLADIDQVLA